MPKMAAASQTGPRASQPGGLGWSYSEASGRHCLITFLIIPRYSYQIVSFIDIHVYSGWVTFLVNP